MMCDPKRCLEAIRLRSHCIDRFCDPPTQAPHLLVFSNKRECLPVISHLRGCISAAQVVGQFLMLPPSTKWRGNILHFLMLSMSHCATIPTLPKQLLCLNNLRLLKLAPSAALKQAVLHGTASRVRYMIDKTFAPSMTFFAYVLFFLPSGEVFWYMVQKSN